MCEGSVKDVAKSLNDTIYKVWSQKSEVKITEYSIDERG